MAYPMIEKKKISKPLRMDELEISKFSAFVWRGFLQHAENGWPGHHTQRYHMYLISARYELTEAVAFLYGASFLEWKAPASNIEKHSSQKAES